LEEYNYGTRKKENPLPALEEVGSGSPGGAAGGGSEEPEKTL